MSSTRWNLPSGPVLNLDWLNSAHTATIDTEIETVQGYLQQLKSRRNALASHLLRLPPGVICTVIEHLICTFRGLGKAKPTLKSCSLACTDLCAVARPFIFSEISLNEPARTIRFALAAPHLYGLAHTLVIAGPIPRVGQYNSGEGTLPPLRRVKRIVLHNTRKLQRLLEVPIVEDVLAQISHVEIDDCDFNNEPFLSEIATIFPALSALTIERVHYMPSKNAPTSSTPLSLASFRLGIYEIHSQIFIEACCMLKSNSMRTLHLQLPKMDFVDRGSFADAVLRRAGANLRTLSFIAPWEGYRAADSAKGKPWDIYRLTAEAMLRHCPNITHLHVGFPLLISTLWISESIDFLHLLRLLPWEAAVFEVRGASHEDMSSCITVPMLSSLCTILPEHSPRMVRYVFDTFRKFGPRYEQTHAEISEAVGEPVRTQVSKRKNDTYPLSTCPDELDEYDLSPLVPATSKKTVFARFHIDFVQWGNARPIRRIYEMAFIVRDRQG